MRRRRQKARLPAIEDIAEGEGAAQEDDAYSSEAGSEASGLSNRSGMDENEEPFLEPQKLCR